MQPSVSSTPSPIPLLVERDEAFETEGWWAFDGGRSSICWDKGTWFDRKTMALVIRDMLNTWSKGLVDDVTKVID
jgi:transcription initiation factor TFIID subunit TAF12